MVFFALADEAAGDGMPLNCSEKNKHDDQLFLLSDSNIRKFLDETPIIDWLLENEFTISVGDKERNAMNLALVVHYEGLLFTLGLDDSLRKNILLLKGKKENRCIENLYGLYP